jgi:hypothetical protein
MLADGRGLKVSVRKGSSYAMLWLSCENKLWKSQGLLNKILPYLRPI